MTFTSGFVFIFLLIFSPDGLAKSVRKNKNIKKLQKYASRKSTNKSKKFSSREERVKAPTVKDPKTQLMRFEISSVNYLQSSGKGHSVQVAWLPRLLTFKKKWSLSSRLGATFLPKSASSENFLILSGDLVLAYQYGKILGFEIFSGGDFWDQDKLYIEAGAGITLGTNGIHFLNFFSDDFFLGHSLILSPIKRTQNLSLGFRKSF